jgi:hypothetical protein
MDVMMNGVKEKDHALEFTKLGDYLCDQTCDAVANILVFGLESLEEVF